jgi:hypothetical protein
MKILGKKALSLLFLPGISYRALFSFLKSLKHNTEKHQQKRVVNGTIGTKNLAAQICLHIFQMVEDFTSKIK